LYAIPMIVNQVKTSFLFPVMIEIGAGRFIPGPFGCSESHSRDRIAKFEFLACGSSYIHFQLLPVGGLSSPSRSSRLVIRSSCSQALSPPTENLVLS
jgi:hypothetical protein